MSYYEDELKRVEPEVASEYPLKIKIMGITETTKYFNINKESIPELIAFLKRAEEILNDTDS